MNTKPGVDYFIAGTVTDLQMSCHFISNQLSVVMNLGGHSASSTHVYTSKFCKKLAVLSSKEKCK
jgi:hypothetical protein